MFYFFHILVTDWCPVPCDMQVQGSEWVLGRKKMSERQSEALQTDRSRAPVLTGKGSAPSWITKPSIRWVRMSDLTKAWAGLLSPLCWLLLVFPFPEVMTGAMAAPHLSTQAAWQTQQVLVTWTWTHTANLLFKYTNKAMPNNLNMMAV